MDEKFPQVSRSSKEQHWVNTCSFEVVQCQFPALDNVLLMPVPIAKSLHMLLNASLLGKKMICGGTWFFLFSGISLCFVELWYDRMPPPWARDAKTAAVLQLTVYMPSKFGEDQISGCQAIDPKRKVPPRKWTSASYRVQTCSILPWDAPLPVLQLCCYFYVFIF